MGGLGSGRRADWGRDTLDRVNRLHISKLKQAGALKAGWAGAWLWVDDGKEKGRIDIESDGNSIMLAYHIRRGGGEWQPVSQRIPLTRTACHYGGHRDWFSCSACGSRVGVLYLAGRFFLCRHCSGLKHSSQYKSPIDRKRLAADRISYRLWQQTGCYAIGDKPKGMHWATYQRLKDRHRILRGQIDMMAWGDLERLQGYTDRAMKKLEAIQKQVRQNG